MIYVATKTLNAIEDALKADQGGRFRGFQEKVLPQISDAYRQEEDGFRAHLGASVLGYECARQVFYGWRWSLKQIFNGKTLRLFNRGHLEEGRFISLFLMIGAKIYQQDEEGKQFRISHINGHIGGSGDGVAVGIPDLPAELPCLLEFKTHGEKSFINLAGVAIEKDGYITYPNPRGVRDSKPAHYVQMQIYMQKMKLTCGLYCAVNKNTDHIYMELIGPDRVVSEKFLDRGEKIVFTEKAPKKITNSPYKYPCSFCDYKEICHYGAIPAINCRTCHFSAPNKDGTWDCKLRSIKIDEKLMSVGCEKYSVAGFYLNETT